MECAVLLLMVFPWARHPPPIMHSAVRARLNIIHFIQLLSHLSHHGTALLRHFKLKEIPDAIARY